MQLVYLGWQLHIIITIIRLSARPTALEVEVTEALPTEATMSANLK
jgi:hypothetical protein